MRLYSAVTFGAGILTALAQNTSYPTIDYNSAPPNLSTLANNSLFEKWRPRAHVIPYDGHVGDPCMHYTDPNTGLFHVSFLHEGAAGATTDDLVTYYDLNPEGAPFIEAGGINDPLAVFDGSVIPAGINGTPTLLYTSVSYFPIQWTVNYTKGSETQSLATSTDGGRNFTKLTQGPAIPGPPFGVNVTGFRDPYVFQNPTLDRAYGSTEDTWYATISGGVHNVGPGLFLYRQYDSEFREWEYLGEFWHEPANSTWQNGTGAWAGRWGYNFEVSNIFSLDSRGYAADGEIFATIGAEWSEDPIVPQVSQFREMLWAAGELAVIDREVRFVPTLAGKLDWGTSAYAAAGKVLPSESRVAQNSNSGDRFITYLWLTGDYYGTSPFALNQQGWDSALLLPRELSVGTIENVVNNELVDETGASWRIDSADTERGTVSLTTLKQQIAREPLAAFTGNTTRRFTENARNLTGTSTNGFNQQVNSSFYLLTTSIHFPQSARNSSSQKTGLKILTSEYESTTVYYQFSNESMIIDRSNSSAIVGTTDNILTGNEAGRLRLFDIQDNSDTVSVETLNLTIVVDNGVVEVWANDRFAVSTWVWPWYSASKGIQFYHEGDSSARFGEVTIYEGLENAWPERQR